MNERPLKKGPFQKEISSSNIFLTINFQGVLHVSFQVGSSYHDLPSLFLVQP